eukprot:TRINITY_DN27226_c0_g1_i1.p1 TRINITY_DN27226_c0_g1~~TRINITY_DN27226_c0_g1_i1.p1  ORF type:complete len:203 (-),score=47.80 TRINITY_DN27226_c0_g1_i1:251-859(-)
MSDDLAAELAAATAATGALAPGAFTAADMPPPPPAPVEFASSEAILPMDSGDSSVDPSALAELSALSQSQENQAAYGYPGGWQRKEYSDNCAIHINGLVDDTTPEELYEHFSLCGEVKRITIKVDRATGNRLGFAYIDFAEEQNVVDALVLDGSMFKDQQIKVNKKRPSNEKGKGGWGYGKGGGYGKGKGGGWGKGKSWGPY